MRARLSRNTPGRPQYLPAPWGQNAAKRRFPGGVIALSVLTLLLAACGSQPPAPEQNPAGVESRTPGAVKVDTTPVAPVKLETFDPNSMAALKDPRSPLSKRSVYFDYDSYVVKDEFQALLTAHGKFLSANPAMKMLIQGNADERGSREYNLALGQKRADAVKKALALLGAREDQLESVSLGEEKTCLHRRQRRVLGKKSSRRHTLFGASSEHARPAGLLADSAAAGGGAVDARKCRPV